MGKHIPIRLTAEAQLITLACSEPPAGHTRWSLRLLAERLVELEIVDSISHVTVGQVLKKTKSSRGVVGRGALGVRQRTM